VLWKCPFGKEFLRAPARVTRRGAHSGTA